MLEPVAAISGPEASVSFDINAVAVKIPEFWTDNAWVWFAQAKAQITIRNVSSTLTKFYYCVASLNHADAAQVFDLIEDPPKDEPYESLKQHLTELHTLNPF